MNTDKKTAEEILADHSEKHNGVRHDYTGSWVLEAMEAYADQYRSQPSEKWISVEERCPLTQERVLAFGVRELGDAQPYTAVFLNNNGIRWLSSGELLDNVTHWQPLPSPPPKQ
jgi:hypothetical protein